MLILVVIIFVVASFANSQLAEVGLQEKLMNNEEITGSSIHGNPAIQTPPLVLELEHSVDGYNFTHRSKFTVNLNDEGKYIVSEAEGNVITAESIEGFKQLLRTNELYKIRTRSLPGNSSSQWVVSALPACYIQRSGFKEDITVFVGIRRNVVGFSYSSPVIALSRPCDAEAILAPITLLTRLKVTEGETSMVVPMQAQGPKPQILQGVDLGAYYDENMKMHGEKGPQAQGNQSFLRRYWYIVVFMLIYFFMRDDTPDAPAAKDPAKTD